MGELPRTTPFDQEQAQQSFEFTDTSLRIHTRLAALRLPSHTRTHSDDPVRGKRKRSLAEVAIALDRGNKEQKEELETPAENK